MRRLSPTCHFPLPLVCVCSCLSVSRCTTMEDALGTYDASFVFYLNGQRVERSQGVDPEQTLLQFLRSPDVGLTGAKLGCSEGGCGACTVMLSEWDNKTNEVLYRFYDSGCQLHRPVNSCIYPLAACEGKAVTTVEGVGSTHTKLHPLQERIARMHGTQCGFCTPGFVMAAYTLLRNHPNPTEAEIQESLDGNLCRCTGYRPILDAIKTFCTGGKVEVAKTQEAHDDIEDICPSSGLPCSCKDPPPPDATDAHKLTQLSPYHADTEATFPEALITHPRRMLCFRGPRSIWLRPANLAQLLEMKAKHPHGQLVVGNTEVALEGEAGKGKLHTKERSNVFIYAGDVPELKENIVGEDCVTIGAGNTVNGVRKFLREVVASTPDVKTETIRALIEQISRFGNTQIRSVASIAGNVVTASICGDINPVLWACNARLVVMTFAGEKRQIPMRKWFLGYHKVDLKEDEILHSIIIPYTRPLEFARSYKVARRRQDDLSIVNAGFRVLLEARDNKFFVAESQMCFGGMSQMPVEAPRTQAFLLNKEWCEETFRAALLPLADDLPLSYSRRTTVEYRRCLTTSLFFKFFTTVNTNVSSVVVNPSDVSASVATHPRIPQRGEQHFAWDERPGATGKPFMHLAGIQHATGEALFVDDTPKQARELRAHYVLATRTHAKILKIDATKALAHSGVVTFLSAKDVPGKLEIGVIAMDEELFAQDEVIYHGQPLGIVVAESHEVAREAAGLVEVEYGPDLPALLTIEDALAADSYIGEKRTLKRGNAEEAIKNAPFKVEGTIHIGGQYHNFIETHACICYPGENDEFTLISANQGNSKVQACVASVLSIPQHKIVSKIRRVGGSFGGKETRCLPLACASALASFHTRRPVRMTLDREVDMSLQGMRHPAIARYKAGFDKEGHLLGFDTELSFDGGCSLDLSESVMELALLHSDNCYWIPNFHAYGCVVKTNRVSNTAFRGFGRPQSIQCIETVMERIAEGTGLPAAHVRELNLYHEGDRIPAGMVCEHCNIRRMWQELLKSSEYEKHQRECDEFNKKNRWRKRGVALMPFKHGIAFIERFLNQAAALLHVYPDGTVLVTICGVEMGQGLFTKMAQLVASELSIPLEQVHIVETSTDKLPNQTVTAASSGADLNGGAVVAACQELKCRLAPIREKFPGATFREIATKAYFAQINLSVTGFFVLPNVGWTFDGSDPGQPFPYLCYGAVCSVVEIDTLTGDFRPLRTDILQDVGVSLNPSIDIGQIEGAFIQGMGYFTLEQLVYSKTGALITRGPSTYKPPTADDIPLDFRVTLLREAPNPAAVYSSKAIGEPPFTLAYSVHLAIRHAIASARADHELQGFFPLDCPATCERIRLACCDTLLDQFTHVSTTGEAQTTPSTGCLREDKKGYKCL